MRIDKACREKTRRERKLQGYEREGKTCRLMAVSQKRWGPKAAISGKIILLWSLDTLIRLIENECRQTSVNNTGIPMQHAGQ